MAFSLNSESHLAHSFNHYMPLIPNLYPNQILSSILISLEIPMCMFIIILTLSSSNTTCVVFNMHSIFFLLTAVSALLGSCQETSIEVRRARSSILSLTFLSVFPFLKCIVIPSAFLLLSSSSRHCPVSSLGPKYTITAVLLAHSTSQGCFHCLLLLQPKRVTKPWIPGVSWKVTGAGSMGMRFPLAYLDELRRASTGSALFVTARLFLPHLGRLLTQSQQYLV